MELENVSIKLNKWQPREKGVRNTGEARDFKWNFKWDLRFEKTVGAKQYLWQGWGEFGVKVLVGDEDGKIDEKLGGMLNNFGLQVIQCNGVV